jgi:large-conductance mechanosensitive channel
MDQPAKPFPSEGADGRRWIGRLIIAVILGEALWGLIVSVMNNVIVPWVGDVMGPSSGLPTSFTQRPYNYPELFVSVFEFCIAGLVAAVINYFFQRPAARRVKTVKSVPTSPPGPIRVISQATPSSAPTETAPPQFGITPAASPVSAPAQDVRMYPVIPSILVPAGSAEPAAPVAEAAPVAAVPEAKPATIAPVVPAVPKPVASKPAPPAPKAEPAKPKKPKNVYYNIVGEPMPSDDD